MSWHFSQALVEEYLQENCSDGEQCAPLKLNPMPRAFLSKDRMTAFSTRSLSGMTFAPLTESHGEELLTWFLGDFRAKTSASQEKEKEYREKDRDYGVKCGASLAKWDRQSYSWKTRQLLLFEEGRQSLVTLPKWGLMQNGELWELEPVRYVKGKDSGLSLLRPTAQCWKAWTFTKIDSLIRKNQIGRASCRERV